MMKNILIIILGLLCIINSSYSATLTEAQINKLKRSVVRIRANGKVGTGFIYLEGKYAVTAFHVISGTNGTVRIQYPSLGVQTYTGRVVKTLKKADLALIEIDNFRNVSPLNPSSSNPAFNTEFTTIGFLWDAPDTHSKDIKKRETKALENFIPSATRNDIAIAQCPSLQLPVYCFEGNPLVPGYSGAPIFHSDEGIIGISDGGIQNGIASVSWGIPAGQLSSLMQSTEYVAGNQIASQSHFSADIVENPNYTSQFITMESHQFNKVRTENLLNIMHSTDDIHGLNQLLATFPPQIDKNILFDVYQDFQSGATFILPEGFILRRLSDRIEVISPDLGSKLTIKSVELRIGEIQEMQTESSRMEMNAFSPLSLVGHYWNADASFSYVAAMIRPDGFWARRKSFIQIRPGNQFSQPTVNSHVFESFVYKRDLMLQLYTINMNYNTNYFMQRQPCNFNGFQGTDCQVILRQLKNWMALIAATHFATFSLDRA